ncbi:MAG: amidohydrolase family protein [Acidobacteria bacterium]|nr:amidohydrolase family protein [Acidobacteriota bacterium]
MRESIHKLFLFTAVLLLWFTPVRVAGQGGLATALVIEGGTLIDGNGGAPVRDVLIIVQGNKITNVSRKGQVSYPANAQVIQADGKFIVPGLWDSQVNYAWFWGEAMLVNGVTSIVDIGNGEEVGIAYRDAVLHGKVRGPRTFIGIGHIGGARPGQMTGLETPLSTRQEPKSVAEARETAKRLLAAGADMIMFHDGSFPEEYYKAAYEEAHRAGKAAFLRSNGPGVYPREAALVGADAIPHSIGVGHSIARDPSKWNNELDRFADMDDAKAAELIQVLVQHRVSLVPNIVHVSPGYPKDWALFEAKDMEMFSDRDLLAYYPDNFLQRLLSTYRGLDEGAVRARRMKGYQNLLRFHKMYVDAGGYVLAGGDTNGGKAPGNIVHHELATFAEAGFTPMQALQSATKWAAETLRVLDKLGTIEAGKLADLVIVNADPLADVANLHKIDSVVFDGKVVDRTYHPWFSSPFAVTGLNQSHAVESLPWVAILKQATFRGGRRGGGTAPDPAASPQPAIETVSPVMVTAGSPTLQLAITGFNFVRRTRVYFDGISVPYRRVSATELQVTLDENLLRRAGRFDIVVKNPGPVASPEWGDGTSNTAHLIVNFQY